MTPPPWRVVAFSPTKNCGGSPLNDSMYTWKFFPPFGSVADGLIHCVDHTRSLPGVCLVRLGAKRLRSDTTIRIRYRAGPDKSETLDERMSRFGWFGPVTPRASKVPSPEGSATMFVGAGSPLMVGLEAKTPDPPF